MRKAVHVHVVMYATVSGCHMSRLTCCQTLEPEREKLDTVITQLRCAGRRCRADDRYIAAAYTPQRRALAPPKRETMRRTATTLARHDPRTAVRAGPGVAAACGRGRARSTAPAGGWEPCTPRDLSRLSAPPCGTWALLLYFRVGRGRSRLLAPARQVGTVALERTGRHARSGARERDRPEEGEPRTGRSGDARRPAVPIIAEGATASTV